MTRKGEIRNRLGVAFFVKQSSEETNGGNLRGGKIKARHFALMKNIVDM